MRRHDPSRLFRDNPVLKLVLGHAALGAGFGLAFACALVIVDAHHIGTLIRESDSGLTAFLLLAGGFMVTFGSMVAGGALMLIDHGSGPGGGHRFKGPRRALVPVPVRVRRTNRPRD
jgi:hypothetical protein